MMEKSLSIWVLFIVFVLALLFFDLGFFHKKSKEINFKESLSMSCFYIFIAFLFGFWIWHLKGLNGFAEYTTGFLVEKSLALDNIFVISMVFTTLSIPKKYQHRVLFWGILGVIVLRALMIGLGAIVVAQFKWVLYLFSAFMIITGIKMLFLPEKPMDISKNPILLWMQRNFRVTKELHEDKFFVWVQQSDTDTRKKLYVTPLLVALVLIEFIDVIFAIDSIPAIFAITQDTYIVYTSNIFAILGLRALYFALAAVIGQFRYLKYALSLVLIFIGSKIFIADAFDLVKIPPLLSLSVTLGLLGGGVLLSLMKKKETKDKEC